MELIHGATLLLMFTAAVLIVISQRWLVDALIEAIQNFRGGPPTGMHPSPANDGALLRRRRKSE
ncbi:MAG: hypothetical protein JWP63_2300 [Candidatus Solibacter sp.]|jgi:hypothetical protein|nr:hypothetical protein [Candidatus Solibacter sp.]